MAQINRFDPGPHDADLQKRLGQAIQSNRRTKGFTQLELADRIGVGRSTIANLEGGRYLPSGLTLLRLVRLLDLDIRQI